MTLQLRSSDTLTQPRIYYVHPLELKGLEDWIQVFRHAAGLGFDTVLTAPLYERGASGSAFVARHYDRIDPALDLGESLIDAVGNLAGHAAAAKINLMMDLVLDRQESVEADYRLIDPRIAAEDAGAERSDKNSAEESLGLWTARLQAMANAGIAGFRCLGLGRNSPDAWRRLISAVHAVSSAVSFLAWTPGTDFNQRTKLTEAGFTACFSSIAWWDGRETWFAEEYNLQRRFAAQIPFPEAPYSKRTAHGTDGHEILKRKSLRALKLAAGLRSGLLVPMGFEYGAALALDATYGDGGGLGRFQQDAPFDLTEEIRSANASLAATKVQPAAKMRLVAGGANKASVLLQGDADASSAEGIIRITLINRDLRGFAAIPTQSIDAQLSGFAPDPIDADSLTRKLSPGEVREVAVKPTTPIALTDVMGPADAVASSRIAIEDVTPAVDDGRFPVKRIVGDIIRVEADIFADGHDVLAASLAWRAADAEEWDETPLSLALNDRWFAEFPLTRLGRYEFAVRAWKNPFAIFRYELAKKSEAGLDLRLEIEEGKALVASVMSGAPDSLAEQLENLGSTLNGSSQDAATALFLAPETAALMNAADPRPFLVQSKSYPVDAERKAAGFASWYQIFPRSQSGDPKRHGTFGDVIGRLPAIKAMGFDVLYFPPIHPIGSTNRKGRNNTLNAGPDDPGSPYAIGSADGGHDAIHPELGTVEDFRELVDRAREAGLEIALDLAIQASPDHPWLKDHPGWFDWRPDGTIRYAENPPKKYEDIVNVDFYAKDARPALWTELRDIVQTWVDRGVKLFRVDNPHTKPLPFWEWMIGDIRSRHPEVVFLSEAFTRPKVMYRLAKVGFSQSYTYFTWRNAKWELEQYMRELTTTDAKDFFRPHFFVNTHDINPDFLQNAPRPAFLIRAALAATLSGLWGVYNGFELCEGRPDAKRKEYADSEKYEIRAWDYDRPGNIIPEITMLNRIRSENPALHSHRGLTLLSTTNDKIMFFEKADPERGNVLLITVCLDPYNTQEGNIEIPLWLWNKGDDGTLFAEDLVDGHRFEMHGKWQPLRLDPWSLPFSIWRISGER